MLTQNSNIQSQINSQIFEVNKKQRRRIIRSTRLTVDAYNKILKDFQNKYPRDFPKQEMVATIPKLLILKRIKKEKKIILSDLLLSRFFHHYIAKQYNKSLSNPDFKNYVEQFQIHYPKSFSQDLSKTPSRSIFHKVEKDQKIKIDSLTLHRFVNQYLKKRKSFLKYQEKKYHITLNKVQNIYPNAFSKNSKKLLKLGIFEDIKKDGKLHTTDNDLKSFLNHYTKQEDYLQCYFDNPVRHDLHGNIVAPTTKQERFFAKKLLKKLQKK